MKYGIVLNTTYGGKRVVEGVAEILGPARDAKARDRYHVRFLEEDDPSATCDRFIQPGHKFKTLGAATTTAMKMQLG